jgi:tRNA splicing endonuclease
MNRQLQPRGITVKTALKEGCLHIMLESAQINQNGHKKTIHQINQNLIEVKTKIDTLIAEAVFRL